MIVEDGLRWGPLVDALSTAVLLLDEHGELVRQNEAADGLARLLPCWPPLPLDRFRAGPRCFWSAGRRLRGQLVEDGARCWLTLELLALPSAQRALVMVLDEDGVVCHQSETVTRLGLSLLGRELAALIEPAEREDLNNARAAGGGEDLMMFLDHDGQRLLLSGSLVDHRDDPAVGGLLLVCQEDTRLQQAEQRIHELERRFLRLLEGIPAAVVLDDPSGGTQYINTHARALFEELGVPLHDIDRWLRSCPGAQVLGTEDPYPRARMPTIRARQGERCTIDDLEVQRNGRRTILEVSAAPVRGRYGDILYIVTTLQTITARRRLEQHLQQIGRLDAIGQLAGELAHDFNNFLHAIGAYGRLALDSLDPEHPAYADVEEVLQIAHRAGSLTRQLLTVSRRQPMSIQKLSLNDVISRSADLLQRMAGEQVSIELALDPASWPVRADAAMLERALLNLVLNARDALPSGGRVTISTENVVLDKEAAAMVPESSAGAYTMMIIRDSGTGMSPEVLSRIFEPFFTTKAVGKGTGLGLSMVYGVVRQMDGFIQVYSTPEVGTEFRIALQRASAPSMHSDITDSFPGDLSASVMLVDGEAAMRRVVVKALTASGHSVVAAGSAEEALALLREGVEVDVVIVEIDLPGTSGVVLVEQLRALQPSLQALFVARRPPEETIPGHFLSKPFTTQALSDMMRRLLIARP